MRIAVDGRHLAASRGVARYSASMLSALRGGFGSEEWCVFEGGSRASHFAAAVLGRPRLDLQAGGADVVWLPAPAPVAVSRGVPYVVTVHDLSWVLRPADFTAYERVWHAVARLRALVDDAARVIAVSAATRDALAEHWGIEESKVAVVHSGPGFGVRHVSGPHDRKRDARPYFLVVGALEPRKATDVALRALASARARGLLADAVFAGDGRVKVSGEGVRVERAPTDDRLAELYANALAVVHPAHLEGFGFPPIEGLLHGTPAIVADLPVYDETIGPGALRFPPGDPEALAEQMLRLAENADLRTSLVAEGRLAVQQLSWQTAAQQTHAVLQQAAR